MSLVEKFNNLNGKTNVSRKTLEKLLELAEKEKHKEISKRIIVILKEYPDDTFDIQLKNLIEPYGLNGVDTSLFEYENTTDDENNGLNKPVSTKEIYDMITQKMLNLIEQSNSKDYKKKWKGRVYGTGYLIPFNFESKKRYRGVNNFLLTDPFEPMKNPFFLTFKQVEELGGKIKKGAKGKPVVYFTMLYKINEIDFGTYDINKAHKVANEKGFSINDIESIPILKYYNVFNGDDIEGINFDLDNFKIGYIENELPATEDNKIPVADAIANNYPKPAPTIKHGGDKAFFSPTYDLVQMPHLNDFETSQDYYRTLFHELSHSTGHSKRLNRKFGKSMRSKDYAFEELVAEWGAVFLSAEAGIIFHNNKNHASYLKGWNNALTHIENDNRFIMRACTEAQKLTDFILQFDKNGDPLYLKEISKKSQQKKSIKSENKKNSPTLLLSVRTRKKTISRGLNRAVLDIKKKEDNKTIKPISSNPKVKKIGASNNTKSEYYQVAGEVGKFLQAVEKKPVHSVVITMDGQQGAGKTTTLYKFMEAFAVTGNKSLFISGEEHPDSDLAKEKVKKYLSPKAQNNLDSIGEVESAEELYSLIEPYEIIFIDSWQKLLRMVGNIRLDEDLRKRFNGKVFVIIFQQTTTGRTKGGAEVVFDGDIIIKMIKELSFSDNYAFFDKNRYTKIPIENIRYNIATGKIYNPNQPVLQPIQKLSFQVN